MNQPLDFQSIILRLLNFWADHGCMIWQPYHTEVGAGTYNPATFLRVLGPEPWNVAYVEPSIRPDDGRYGENPNRFYQHYQMQVILKPDPGNPQELYLQSLEALGIDQRSHDIRFVEDNWESPALGAWGLGWEVWLDGQEITQFTYFQQAGGMVLDPVSVELTYGLERIAMALQHVHDFRNLRWNSQYTYGDIHLQSEQEFSKYAFEVADVERLKQAYQVYSAEAESALDLGLVLPAHDYVLKCSQTFNLLDTRGAVGVTERQALFGQMRDLARRVANLYVEQRQRLEFPWLDETGVSQLVDTPFTVQDARSEMISNPQPMLFEIGVEELPAADLSSALEQILAQITNMLVELRLDYQELKVSGTPRRLVVMVGELAPCQQDLEQLVKGPPAERAFDQDGFPTKAAEGFARSRGVSMDQLEIREMDGGQYVVAVVKEKGRQTIEVLAEALPKLIAGIKFDKSMRWNKTNVSFSRPIRWLMALFGDQVIPFEYAGMVSGRSTFGLRFREPQEFSVNNVQNYLSILLDQGIILDPEKRRQIIAAQVNKLATEIGGQIPDDPDLLDEVTNLVEAPTALRGQFDEEYLRLPQEVLVSVMRKHQRYFPVEGTNKLSSDETQLLPYFITVRNGDEHDLDTVTKGNEDVIQARFADASYFVRSDLKKPLEKYVQDLGLLTFHKDLGSMLDKTHRIIELVKKLKLSINLNGDEFETAVRAAYLCKADLVTSMVVEMTSLQGIMGKYYALASGEPQPVALAIYEHYLPRSAGDDVPQSKSGLVVGIADRIDTLAGLFAVGLMPTGTRDPFAMRRSALGLVQALIDWDLNLDLRQVFRLAGEGLPVRMDADELETALSFVLERLRNSLLEQGFGFDIVDSVISEQGQDPASAVNAVNELSRWVSRDDWGHILPAYARCVRITRDLDERYLVVPEAFVAKEEKDLCEAIKKTNVAPRKSGSVDDFLNAFLPMVDPINAFFDAVLVMSEDPGLRSNRLGMLQIIAAMTDGVADFSRLEGF